MARTQGLQPIGESVRKIIDKVMKERAKNKKGKPIRTQPKLPGLKTGSVIEKKGATKQSAEEADKAIRKIVLDNPVLTKSANIIRKIDKLKAQGDLPVKKSKPIRTQPKLPGLNKGGGADTGRVGEQRSRIGVAVNKLSRKMRNKDRLTNRDKELAEELSRKPQSRNKMQPSRSMSIDTTTGISKMKEGGYCRGAGAAVKGTKFQGVF